MTDTRPGTDLTHLRDRAEITDTLYRYAAGLDLGDAEALTSALTEDATVDLGPATRRIGFDFPPLAPRDTVVSALVSGVGPLDTSHAISNVRFTVQGEVATVHAYALAQHYPARLGSKPEVTRHALMMNRYTAEMTQDGDRWRIRRLSIANAWFDGDPTVLLGQ